MRNGLFADTMFASDITSSSLYVYMHTVGYFFFLSALRLRGKKKQI